MNKHTLLFVFLFAFNAHLSLESRITKNKLKKSKPIATQIDVSEDFGKKHFIVGMPQEHWEKYQARKEEQVVGSSNEPFNLFCDGCVKRVLFSPDDQVQKILLHLLEQEKESLCMTAYSFTDGDIAQALIDAHDRGVRVEIIVDPGCMFDRFGKIGQIKEHEINIFVYNPDHLKKDKKGFASSIMHNKFIVFGKNSGDKSLVWTGSFNWTKAANRRNQENVVILDDKYMVNAYKHHFELLKDRCNNNLKKETTEAGIKIPEKDSMDLMLSKKGTLFENNEGYA